MAACPSWTRIEEEKEKFKDSIHNFYQKVCDDITLQASNNIPYLEHLLERLDAAWSGYKRTCVELENYPNMDENEIRTELSQIAFLYDDVRKTLLGSIKELSARQSRPAPKVSEINLPKFAGEHINWSPWSAIVKSSVIDVDLPVHDKISLIISALEGRARKCVGLAEGQDQAELDRIWSKLKEVYENKYQLARAHMGVIFDLPILQEPNANKLQIMIDRTEYSLRALERLENQVDTWDTVICEILLRKLDQDTLKAWEMNRNVDELPKLSTLFDFFRRRIQAIQNLGHAAHEGQKRPRREWLDERRRGETKESHVAKTPKTSGDQKENITTATKLEKFGKCPYRPTCVEKPLHFLWNCKEFRKLGNMDRTDLVDKWGLCRRCVLKKHDLKSCTAKTCGNCEDDVHNYLLCPKHKVMVNSLVVRPPGTSKHRPGKFGHE